MIRYSGNGNQLVLWLGGISIVAILIMAVMYRHETNAMVESFSWMRAITIQQYKTVSESGWTVPYDGRVTNSYRAYYGDEDYISGYEDKKECNSDRSVCITKSVAIHSTRPIYKTKYNYDIDKWVDDRQYVLTSEDHNPIWPDISDIRPHHNPPQVGDEKEGTKTSRYTLTAKTKDNKTYKIDITENLWRSFEIENRCVLIIDIFGVAQNVKH